GLRLPLLDAGLDVVAELLGVDEAVVILVELLALGAEGFVGLQLVVVEQAVAVLVEGAEARLGDHVRVGRAAPAATAAAPAAAAVTALARVAAVPAIAALAAGRGHGRRAPARGGSARHAAAGHAAHAAAEAAHHGLDHRHVLVLGDPSVVDAVLL